MYADSPSRIALTGAYVPDWATLVPMVIVLPVTPVVSLPDGHADVSMIVEEVVEPVEPLGEVVAGFAVERFPLHAAATSANTMTRTIAAPERTRERWLG